MAERDKGTDKRLTLAVTEVAEPKDVGKDKPLMKLVFKATGEDGDKEHEYFAFSTRLFDYIKKDTTIECDVNISKREWGDNIFTDRKVTQIYTDGQPVGGRRSGGYREDSPEKIASIEAQKRADITAQLWIADKLKEKDPEVIKMRAWLMNDAPPAKPAADEAPGAMKQAKPPLAAKSTKDKGDTPDLRSLPIKNLGDLFSACLKHFKLNQSAVLKGLGGIAKEDIADPQDAWLQIVEAKS